MKFKIIKTKLNILKLLFFFKMFHRIGIKNKKTN